MLERHVEEEREERQRLEARLYQDDLRGKHGALRSRVGYLELLLAGLLVVGFALFIAVLFVAFN